ncbi:MAG: anaerobic glycerol-3-phosphate dehydrogenase subunit C [Deltaproteobacteria bacterium]|nr:anaerobic glycerol-3-phosphate dehydrogenase subunit C [Deltaproteobacteria bacterium]
MIDLENISFDHCIKCTVCTAYCPVARVTPLYPGPKSSGPDTERLRIKNPELVDDTLSYCTNCKRCEIVCPSDVRIADIIQKARHRHAKSALRPRDFFMSRTDLAGSAATLFPSVVNAMTRNRAVKWGMDRLVGISDSAQMPKYASGTFRRKFAKRADEQAKFSRKLVYFTGCYVNYFDHELGNNVVRVLNALGYGVAITNEKCCGVPLIANGFIKKAQKNARHNVDALKAAAGRDVAIVASSSSCAYALTNEYPNILSIDNSRIAPRIRFITRFLAEEAAAGNLPELKPVPVKAVYHAPCHLSRMGGAVHTVDILRRIPELKLVMPATECCGLSGTYGFKKEYAKVATDVGEKLFGQIAAENPDVVVTDCETCKWQIEAHTPYKVVHPVTLLAKAMFGG